MRPDYINGVFEFVGSLMLWGNVRAILKDRKVTGVKIYPVVFWSLWGGWNLFYYPSLHQWASFSGGCFVFVANSAWVVLALYFKSKEQL